MDTIQDDEKALPNRPGAKLSSIPKGARIHKRPLLGRFPNQQRRHGKSNSNSNSHGNTNPRPTRAKAPPAANPSQQRGADGYALPPRAPHTAIIYVSSRASFMSLVKRVRRALDSGPQGTRGLPLTARVAALGVSSSLAVQIGASGGGGESAPPRPSAAGAAATAAAEDALDDVVLIATGRAIQRTVEVGAFLTRDRALAVVPRTRTVHAVDDIVVASPARQGSRQQPQQKSRKNARGGPRGLGDDGEDDEDEEMEGGEKGEGADEEGEEEEEEEEEDQVRVRNVSCVEVGIRWRTTA